jgi:glycosyltransferase involved in cell wall biosynthesis
MNRRSDQPQANVAVCGRFHYNHYVKYLHALDGLNCFYHSSRLGMPTNSPGLPGSKSVNIFPKEYLVHLHSKLLGNTFRSFGFGVYHDLWQLGVLMNWKPAPILHYMLHGNGRMLIRRGHRDGAIVIGEPVNSHPVELRRILNEEHERLGIKSRVKDNLLDRRLAEEASACDHIIAGSHVVKRSFAKQGFPDEKIRVIPYGTDTKRFSPLTVEEKRQRLSGLGDSAFRVICVGSITPRKGHVYLLEAWKRLNIPNSQLLFIGSIDGVMKPVLDRYEGLFTHIPHVPHHLLRHYYGVSDVFVLPSLEDGFAYVCTEALGCGLPVVTTDNTGASEVVNDGLNGFVVSVRNVDAMVEKLERLYLDQDMRHGMSEAAIIKATSSLLWLDYAEKLAAYYKEVG